VLGFCQPEQQPNDVTRLQSAFFVKHSLQQAQLPLRNRASAMHFFVDKLLSITIMTYFYVCRLRNLRPANLLCTKRINFSMRPQHVRMTRDPAVVWCLLSREPLRIPAYSLYCQKLEFLNYMTNCYSIGIAAFNFTQFFRTPRKDVQDEQRATPLSFNVFFLENPSEYPHKPYIIRN